MATIQIKNVSEQTHAELRRRADAAGQSLQQYLLKMLDEQARRPTMAEVMDRVERRLAANPPTTHVTPAEIRQALEDERARR